MAMNRNIAGLSSAASRGSRSGGSGANVGNNTAKPPAKPPATHFLSLPIGHHTPLQEAVSSFTNRLLQTTPALPGLDRSIVVAPRRLHLTFGVMSLVESESSNAAPDNDPSDTRKTLSQALSHLETLRPQIAKILSGKRLSVPLRMMDIMQPDQGNPDNAHVLWLGPSSETEDARRLRRVGELVNKAFKEAGFVTDRRPLKLHCTILNTMYRKPKARGPRQPFSYRSLLTSLVNPGTQLDFRQPVKMDFGSWFADEIQICKMGSHGPEGEYVSCGGLSLT
ncbi:hypothetical protein PAXRUDRAFT_830864 [Paxillus rubicundulus Ve08.2h10]|uniref:A-kinase anchor protein 7-like phosphoesterase domain-containing protein n=1 Tax=Paxillus rubicundulus Ve08.2h10 TaxID=930991 RepID=A0A0D0DY40_9AGAM|nr:hypothetical protein PAXRUDRAFT_830864 [Paxillus rubicundulus Ve08.2h10]